MWLPGEEESTFIKVPIDELNTALMLYPKDGAWDGMGASAIQAVQETPRPVFTTRVEGFKVSWDIPTGAIDKQSQNTKKLSRNETVLWLLPVVVRMRHYAIELSFGKDHEVIHNNVINLTPNPAKDGQDAFSKLRVV